MKKIDLIEIAKNELIPDGYVITGYCSVVPNEPQATCTRDKFYQENSGRITDCIFAEDTTKTKCEHWHRVKSFKLGERNQ